MVKRGVLAIPSGHDATRDGARRPTHYSCVVTVSNEDTPIRGEHGFVDFARSGELRVRPNSSDHRDASIGARCPILHACVVFMDVEPAIALRARYGPMQRCCHPPFALFSPRWSRQSPGRWLDRTRAATDKSDDKPPNVIKLHVLVSVVGVGGGVERQRAHRRNSLAVVMVQVCVDCPVYDLH